MTSLATVAASCSAATSHLPRCRSRRVPGYMNPDEFNTLQLRRHSRRAPGFTTLIPILPWRRSRRAPGYTNPDEFDLCTLVLFYCGTPAVEEEHRSLSPVIRPQLSTLLILFFLNQTRISWKSEISNKIANCECTVFVCHANVSE